jgi:hypothetical protein
MNVNEFDTHSFRIGAATSVFVNEISEEKIKKLGRWSSSVLNVTYVLIESN